MKEINKEEMLKVIGGAGFKASFLSSIVRGVNSFLDVGRSIGSAIRRLSEKKVCPLN